jgi:hypothetical protein
MGSTSYADFLVKKAHIGGDSGFNAQWLPDFLFPFQSFLCDVAIKKGRFALLEDCGLGKTPQLLVWAENVVRKTNGRVLVLSPLAVSAQTKREAERFGIDAYHSHSEIPQDKKIILTNYDKLHLFDWKDFSGVVCDEASCLKNYDGARRKEITNFMRKLKYRLLCTATAAPNDYIELGTLSEALGELGYMDMLMRFFKNDHNTIRPMVYRHKGNSFAQLDDKAKWRFKGHAEVPFWQWVCSWARALRRPSDIDFSDAGFELPPLTEQSHVVKAATLSSGMLFALPAVGLTEQRDERRRTIRERCERAAELSSAHESSVVWCHLNQEGDLLESIVPDCIQVSGSDSEDAKEEKLIAFSTGQVKRLITKSRIAGWGLNWQHCNHSVSFPSHSFEEYYQSLRRFWRFGQKRCVTSDIVTTLGEISVLENLQRKSKAADRMFDALVAQAQSALNIKRSIEYEKQEELPAWL